MSRPTVAPILGSPDTVRRTEDPTVTRQDTAVPWRDFCSPTTAYLMYSEFCGVSLVPVQALPACMEQRYQSLDWFDRTVSVSEQHLKVVQVRCVHHAHLSVLKSIKHPTAKYVMGVVLDVSAVAAICEWRRSPEWHMLDHAKEKHVYTSSSASQTRPLSENPENTGKTHGTRIARHHRTAGRSKARHAA